MNRYFAFAKDNVLHFQFATLAAIILGFIPGFFIAHIAGVILATICAAAYYYMNYLQSSVHAKVQLAIYCLISTLQFAQLLMELTA